MSIQSFGKAGISAYPALDDFEFLLPMVTQDKTALESKVCVVCGGRSARGIHFGVTACAACAAFFRRTIVEKRTYTCRTERENCPIIHGFTQRKNCRHCRYKKCLAMGMLPQKVQNKRRPTNDSFEQLPRTMKVVGINCSVKEQAYRYSILKEQRMKHYGFDLNEVATMLNYFKIARSEPTLLSEYLYSTGALNGFANDDKYSLLKNFITPARLVEQARLTVQYGGTHCNGFHLLDGSYLGATEIEFMRFYSCSRPETEQPLIMDPKFMTRMALPHIRNHLDELIPAVERAALSDAEFTALLNLALWDAAIPELTLHGLETVRKKRQKTIEDLCEYYKSTRMDIQIRLANLIFLLSPLEKDVNIRNQLVTMMELVLAKKPTVQVPAYNIVYMDNDLTSEDTMKCA